MNPDQVLEGLAKLGVDLTRRTLLNYEKWGLIPKATRGGGGPGGRFSLYPEGTIEEAYAAWSLMHGEYGDQGTIALFGNGRPRLNPDGVKFIRDFTKLKLGSLKNSTTTRYIGIFPGNDVPHEGREPELRAWIEFIHPFIKNMEQYNFHFLMAYSATWEVERDKAHEDYINKREE